MKHQKEKYTCIENIPRYFYKQITFCLKKKKSFCLYKDGGFDLKLSQGLLNDS